MRRNGRILTAVVLLLFLLVALFPVYWMLNTSMKSNLEVYQIIPRFWPDNPSLRAYADLLEQGYLTNILNSLITATVVSVGSVFISMFAAYAIARLNFPGKNGILKGVFYSYLMPRSVMFIPLYMLVTFLGLANTRMSLYLVYPTLTIPYSIWMLVSYFRTIPLSLEEAAIVDGCSKFGVMWRITFPLVTPGIFSVLIVSFSLCWSEYLYAFIMINKSHLKTIPLFLSELIVDDMIPWAQVMAGAFIASIPVVILYYISSSKLVSGITSGGVKE